MITKKELNSKALKLVNVFVKMDTMDTMSTRTRRRFKVVRTRARVDLG